MIYHMNDINYFRQACRNIVDNQDAPALNWAVNYAKTGLEMDEDHRFRPHVKELAIRIKGNMTKWRGPIANETRSILSNVIEFWED